MHAALPGGRSTLGQLGAAVALAAGIGSPSAAQSRAFASYTRVCLDYDDTAPLPFTPDKVLGFLFAELDRGLSTVTLATSSSALLAYARQSGAALDAAELAQIRQGVRVLNFEFPAEVRRASPLTDDAMRRVYIYLLLFLQRLDLWAVSWWALLCLGFSGLYRGGELLGDAMTWEQLTEVRLPDGSWAVSVDCPFRKTTKTTRDLDFDVGVVPPRSGQWAFLDAHAAIARLALASGHSWGEGSSPVFSRRAKLTGEVTRSDGGYPDGTARADLRWLLGQAGVADSERYGLHSMRRGGATYLLAAGAPWSEVKKLGGWRSDALQLYDARGADLAVSLAKFLSK